MKGVDESIPKLQIHENSLGFTLTLKGIPKNFNYHVVSLSAKMGYPRLNE
jgi:hypothetical protein